MSDNGKGSIEFKITFVVEPDEDSFHAYCPALKGLHSSGDSEEEALNNASDAAVVYLKSLMKHGDPIPVGIAAYKERRRAIPLRRKGGTRYHTRDLAVAVA